tara:strand:+ start:252 stop:596 length:345 start_codon:yes stop_codon:yes gene_type:complete
MLFVLIKDLRRSYHLEQLEALGDLRGPMVEVVVVEMGPIVEEALLVVTEEELVLVEVEAVNKVALGEMVELDMQIFIFFLLLLLMLACLVVKVVEAAEVAHLVVVVRRLVVTPM